MLSPDVLIQDIDAKGWANLFSLADRRTLYRILGEERETKPPPKRLIIIYQGHEVLKAWHSSRGSLLNDFQWRGPKDLEPVALNENADRVIALERGALSRIFKKFQDGTDLKDDYVKQIFTIIDAVREEIGNGLHFYPEPRIPNIGYDAVNNIFKLMTQDDSTIVFYIFDGNEVWCSAITGIKDGDVDLFTSHDALVAEGFTITDWRKDYTRILEVVGERFREPSFGFFADLKSFARILRTRKTLRALDAARKAKDVIMDPLPMRIKTILGAGKLFGK